MIVVEQTAFHASLLDLIGKVKNELEGVVPEPARKIGHHAAERWLWREIVKDSETGGSFPIYLCVRFLDGRVWAVGIWSRDYLFVLERGSAGKNYFAVVPKGRRYRIEDVNWVSRENDEFVEIGVEG